MQKDFLVVSYFWSCHSVNRQQDLSSSFNVLWILSCCTYLGATRVPLPPLDETEEPIPSGWQRGIPYPLPSWWNRVTPIPPFDEKGYLPPLRWNNPLPHLMKQGTPYILPLDETGVHPPPCWMNHWYEITVVLSAWRQDLLRPAPQRVAFIPYFVSVMSCVSKLYVHLFVHTFVNLPQYQFIIKCAKWDDHYTWR